MLFRWLRKLRATTSPRPQHDRRNDHRHRRNSHPTRGRQPRVEAAAIRHTATTAHMANRVLHRVHEGKDRMNDDKEEGR